MYPILHAAQSTALAPHATHSPRLPLTGVHSRIHNAKCYAIDLIVRGNAREGQSGSLKVRNEKTTERGGGAPGKQLYGQRK